MRRKWAWFVPLAIVGGLLFVAVGGALVQLLWNGLLPPLFGWREVTFWQALGLLVLCRILFGGLGMHGGPRHGVRRRMAERWASMTPEEQERFRHAMRERCGSGPTPGESQGQ
jgi:hypothetical protein